jgi:hypothetical protein
METPEGAALVPETTTGSGINYKALQRNQIRILTLFKSRSERPQIHCSLKSFDNPPPYTALSYTWGNQSRKRKILVDGQPFLATENLENALRHLRHEENDLYLWVDAICIDQNNDEEIEHQIRLMPVIFSNAQETRVWLGAEENNSDRAIDFVERLSRMHLEGSSSVDDTSAEVADRALSGSSQPWEDEAELVALQDLLTRGYWFRVWIVQEIALSRNVAIFCGRRKLNWASVLNATEFMIPHSELGWIIFNHIARHPSLKRDPAQGKLLKTLHDGMQRIISIQSVRNDKLEPGDPNERPPDSLLYLLSNHRSTEATEARDKYYALAGLVSEHDSILSQRSSARSLEEIYMLAAESTTKEVQHGALDFLDFAGWPTKVVNLPSWLPDWSYTRDRASPLLYWQLAGKRHKDMVMLNAPGRANASQENAFLFQKKEKCLAARGFEFDTLNGVGFSRWPRKENPNVQNPQNPTMLDHQKYPFSDELLVEVIWRTFVLNFAHAEGLKAPANWRHLFYKRLFCPGPSSNLSHKLWYEQNKGFEVYGVKLETIAKQERELSPNFDTEDPSAVEEIFGQLARAFDVATRYRRLATTTAGYLCLAPSTSRPGDSIAILLDCHVPVILRQENDHLKFIGTCYVHGIMQGEAVTGLSDEQRLSSEFQIR